jgi:hypothetical protein
LPHFGITSGVVGYAINCRIVASEGGEAWAGSHAAALDWSRPLAPCVADGLIAVSFLAPAG